MSNEDPATSVSGPGGGQPRKSPRQGIGGSPVGSTLSIVLAVVAVVAGFLILRNITDDNDGASSAIGDGTDEVVDSTTTTVDLALTTTTAAPTTTVPPLVTEGATVVVANASGVPGSAGRMSTDARGAPGYTMAEATNATVAARSVDRLLRPRRGRRAGRGRVGRPFDGWSRGGARSDTGADRGWRAQRVRRRGDARHGAGRQDARGPGRRHRPRHHRRDRHGSRRRRHRDHDHRPADGRQPVTRGRCRRRRRRSALSERAPPSSAAHASSTQCFGGDIASSSPKRSVSDSTRRPSSIAVGNAGSIDPTIAAARIVRLGGERGDPADDLAGEARRVEPTFAGDHEVGAVEMVVEIEFVGDEFETGHESTAERGERAAEPAGGTATDDRGHVLAELLLRTSGRVVRAAG